MDPRDALRRWMDGADLSRVETRALIGRLMDGEIDDPMKAGLLVALSVKGETADELAGAAQAMRDRVVAIPHESRDVVDTCGTGGDGKGTFNISTAAALVAAGAGVTIAKHGNRSVSSRSGSADVLEALGVPLDLTPEAVGRALDEIGIAFLFAPRLHPAMREVVGVRRSLGVRTAFNLLGPLTNPAGARRQVMGVWAASLVEKVARVLARLGAEHALVVHGRDGLDELTLTGPSLVAEVRYQSVEVMEIDPVSLGFRCVRPEDLAGGEARDNAARLAALLDGEPGPLAEVTALNAGAAVWVGGAASSLTEGIERAREALRSGAARSKLDALVALAPTPGGGAGR